MIFLTFIFLAVVFYILNGDAKNEDINTEQSIKYSKPISTQITVSPVITTTNTTTVVTTQAEIVTEPIIQDEIPTEEIIIEQVDDIETEFSMEYIGNLKITGYVATGNPTASGEYPYVGGIAMSNSYGLEYGTTIYIDGFGYYILNDTGCSYGVVDVFCDTIDECYNLTSYADVYIVN